MARSPQNPADTRKRGHGSTPPAIREAAILALLTERTVEAAARRAGIDESTLRRWLAKDPAFQADYDTARQTTFQAAMGRIHALTARAVETLEELLEAKEHPSARLGAARTVAEIGMHKHDADTILQKLEALEAATEADRRR